MKRKPTPSIQSPEALLKKSFLLHRQAERAIKTTRITQLLSSLGKVHFVGGYKLNLMMRRDIDIIVLTKKPSSKKLPY